MTMQIPRRIICGVFFITGYLVKTDVLERMCIEKGKLALRIPNEEIKTIFADTVSKWFTDTVSVRDRRDLICKSSLNTGI